jgi:hypothetical protein
MSAAREAIVDVLLGIDTGLDRLRDSVATRWSLAVLLGNLGDALSTLTFLQLHAAQELNPLMLIAYQVSPTWFVAAKLGLVHLGLLLLALNRHARAAQLGEAFGGVMYSVLLLWHVVCWRVLERT